MGKKSKKGTTKAGKGRPGAGKATKAPGQPTAAPGAKDVPATTAPVVNPEPVAVAPVAAVPRTLVPSPVKDETLSPVSATDTADETVSYDGEGDLSGKANAFLSVPEGEDTKQKLPSVSFSDEVVITESNDDTSNNNIETSLPEEPTVTAQDDVLISEMYDASRSTIEVCLSSPDEEETEPTPEIEVTEESAVEVQNEPVAVVEPPAKEEVAPPDTSNVSLSSAKLEDILTETTEDFFASKESPLRKAFGAATDAQQNDDDDQLVESEATEVEAEPVVVVAAPEPEPEKIVAAAPEPEKNVAAPEPEKVLAPPEVVATPETVETVAPSPPAADEPETPEIAITDEVEIGLDKVNVATPAATAAVAEVFKLKEITTDTTLIDTKNAASLTEPGPTEKLEKQKDCCIIL